LESDLKPQIKPPVVNPDPKPFNPLDPYGIDVESEGGSEFAEDNSMFLLWDKRSPQPPLQSPAHRHKSWYQRSRRANDLDGFVVSDGDTSSAESDASLSSIDSVIEKLDSLLEKRRGARRNNAVNTRSKTRKTGRLGRPVVKDSEDEDEEDNRESEGEGEGDSDDSDVIMLDDEDEWLRAARS